MTGPYTAPRVYRVKRCKCAGCVRARDKAKRLAGRPSFWAWLFGGAR